MVEPSPGDPARQVATTYSDLAPDYDEWAFAIAPDLRVRYLARLLSLLAPGASVVELGCGTGLPVAAGLVERGPYLGIDLSPGMLDQARANVPKGEFRVADMRTVELEAASFDAVVACYSIIHVPRADHETVFGRAFRWLRPGGWFVASFGEGALESGTESDWLGAGPMYWSNHGAETTKQLLVETGFEIAEATRHVQQEPGEETRWLWVVCRRP